MEHLPDEDVGRLLTDLSFEQWVDFVFDHPVRKPQWYWDDEADWWGGDPALTASYLARLFEECASLLGRFTVSQVNQGLWYIASNPCSEHMFALFQEDSEVVPMALRRRAVRAMYVLYRDCFAVRCSRHLSHLDKVGTSWPNALNAVCYMWWDLLPFYGGSTFAGADELKQDALEAMRRTLELDHEACLEGALHGLGHWEHHFRREVHETIKQFLRRRAGLTPKLRSYAHAALSGNVL